MILKELLALVEFARTDDGGNGNKKPPARRGGGDDDGDLGSWKKISFKGETVYYNISPVSFQNRTYGLQVQIALRPRAVNAESEFVRDQSVNVYGKNAESADDAAIKVVFKYLNKHGTEPLAKAMDDWRKVDDEFRDRESKKGAKMAAAPKHKKALPAGYKIVNGPKAGYRFVQTPQGKLIPNQGVNDHKTDQDLIDNFYAWKAYQEADD